MDLYVIRRPSAWANLAELEAAGAKSAKIGNEEMLDLVRHRTYQTSSSASAWNAVICSTSISQAARDHDEIING